MHAPVAKWEGGRLQPVYVGVRSTPGALVHVPSVQGVTMAPTGAISIWRTEK